MADRGERGPTQLMKQPKRPGLPPTDVRLGGMRHRTTRAATSAPTLRRTPGPPGRVGRRLRAVQAGMIPDAIGRRRDGGREALVASLDDLAGRLVHEEQPWAAFIGKGVARAAHPAHGCDPLSAQPCPLPWPGRSS
jgi:hypothetical protein